MQVKLIKKIGCIASYFVAVFACPNIVQAAELNLASWNIEWLASKSVKTIPASLRRSRDFSQLRLYMQEISPDVLAFQEVNSANSIKRLVGDGYSVYLSDRHSTPYSANQFDNINQFTGFAVRSDYRVDDVPDLQLISTQKTKLRFASYIILHASKRPLHLLSVHLKAGCKGKKKNSAACALLAKEATLLNGWIRERVRLNESFVILGDFNHNLAYPQDWLWQVLSRDTSGAIALLSRNTRPHCQVRSHKKKGALYRYRSLIDHVVASTDLTVLETRQRVYNEHDVWQYHLSDHCPVTTLLTTS